MTSPLPQKTTNGDAGQERQIHWGSKGVRDTA
jgi:hypothetical protein